MRRNSKHPHIEDHIVDRDAIFGPWRSISEDVNEESDQGECELDEDGSIASGKKNLTWSDEMDVVLIDALLEQVEKGQKIGSTFTAFAYSSVADLVGSKFQKVLSIANVKNRMKTLKSKHTEAQKVLGQSGFGYNESTQMIEATPDVWKAYIMANPKASSTIRHKPVMNYYKLDLLFGKDRATGSMAVGPKERQRQWAKQASSSDDVPSAAATELPTNEASSCGVSSKDQLRTKKTKGGNKVLELVCDELKSLNSGVDAVAKAIQQGNSRNYTEEQLFDEITKIDGLSDVYQMKVYQRLSNEPNSARAFLACPVARRGLWLKVKFDGDS